MSEMETFVQLIQNVLGNDNALRKQSEQLLSQVRESNIDQYFICMLELLKTSPDAVVRNFCSVMLRKQLSVFSERNFTSGWPKISGQTATRIKEEIFPILVNESASNIRHQICDFIGEIGATVDNLDDDDAEKMPAESKEWAKLMPLIMELWMSKVPRLMESTFKIMSAVFNYSSEQFIPHKNDLHTIFKQGLESDDINIQTAAVDAMTSWIAIIPPKDTKIYQDLIPQLMNAVIAVLAKDEYQGQDTLANMIDLVEAEPKFFKKNFDYLFKTMQKICSVKEVEDEGIKQMAIQVICCFAERECLVFQKNEVLLGEFLEMVFAYMIEISEEPDEAWQVPKDGYLQVYSEETDYSGIKYGCSIIDRLTGCIGDQIMLKTLSGLVQKMLQSSDWRFKSTALMALSQVGEHISNMDELAPIVQVVLSFFNDNHPKIRWSAYHVIGMLSVDSQPEFQIKFHEKVLPALLQRFDEPIPRVMSHILNALGNFMEGLPEDQVPLYIEPVLNGIFPFIQKESYKIIRESALTVLASTAEAAKTGFRPYFEKVLPTLYDILKTQNSKESKQLRGQCVECITLIAHSVGKESFARYVNDVVQLLVNIQQNDIATDGTDPQRSYVISGWQRLCLTLGEDFIPYLDGLLPSLFKLLENIIVNGPGKQDDDEDEYFVPTEDVRGKSKKDKMDDLHRVDVNTFDHEEAEISINMIHSFIDELKKGYIPYVEKTTEIILKAVSFASNNNIRENAARCLPSLLSVVKESEYPGKEQILLKMAHMFLNSLWKEVEVEFDPDTILTQIHALKDCIDVCGRFMNENEIEELSSKILKLLAESDKRKTERNKYREAEEDQEEDADVLEEGDDDEEELHVGLAELIGILFKTHKELTLPLVNILYNDVLSKVLQPNLSDKMHKFGIFLIVDMIEFLGPELIPNQWPDLSQALVNFATHKTCYVRQAALYGIGMVAQKSKETFAAMATLFVQKVVESFKIPKGNETEKLFNYATDNSIAALGKILHSNPEKVNVPELASLWFSHLPLKADQPEALVQHEMLVDIVLSNPTLVLGQNGEGVKHLVKVFAQIIDSKMSNEAINTKISQVLKALAAGPSQKLLEEAVLSLSELQKQRIQKTFTL